MTVYKNMAFGLKLRRFPKKEIDERVREAASILGIEELLDRKPKALSGGQRQRVAVGRAIVRKPKVFLFDEPLSNLDAKLRVQMRAELQKLHTRLQSTVVYVTHDQVEAMTMGDRIVVMRDGNILQVDDPLRLYDHPVNKFVAGFIGSPPMNFIDGEVVRRNGGIYFREGTESSESAFSVKLPAAVAAKAEPHVGTVVALGIRPDDIYDREFAQDADPETVVRTTVDVVEPMGAEIILYLSAGSASLVARVDVHTKAKELQSIDMVFDMEKAHLFEKESEVAIT
jgi:multiple sugar transport system ATP-binding protein